MRLRSRRRSYGFTARATLLGAAAFALAACSDDAPTQPRASLPPSGPKTPAAVINILPPGTTFPAKIAFATGSPVGKEARVQLYDKNGAQLATFLAFTAAEDLSAGVEVAVGDVNGDGWPTSSPAKGRRPVGGVSLEAPRMSPDGTKLAVQATRRNDSVVSADGTGTKLFTNDVGGCTTVSWSPDIRLSWTR